MRPRPYHSGFMDPGMFAGPNERKVSNHCNLGRKGRKFYGKSASSIITMEIQPALEIKVMENVFSSFETLVRRGS